MVPHICQPRRRRESTFRTDPEARFVIGSSQRSARCKECDVKTLGGHAVTPDQPNRQSDCRADLADNTRSTCPASANRSNRRFQPLHPHQSNSSSLYPKGILGRSLRRQPPSLPPAAPHSTMSAILLAMALSFEERMQTGERHMTRQEWP